MKFSIFNFQFSIALAFLVALSGCEDKPSITFLRWSPDGQAVAYVLKNGLYVRPLAEDAPSLDATALQLAEDYFAWTPDGQSIIYTSAKEGSWDLWKLDVRSGESARLTRDLAKEHRPTCSPDGDQVFFISWRNLQPDLWSLDLKSGEAKALTNDELEESELSLSLIAGRLAYLVTSEDGSQSIFLRHVWVGETFLLAEGLRGVFQVALSPDGKRIAWAKTEPSGASGIWTASIAKKPKKVKPDRCVRLGPPAASASHIFDWTPDSKQIVYVAQNRLWVKSAGKRGKPEPITPEGWAASMPVSSFEADLIACAVAEKGDLVGVAAMTDEGEERRWAMKDSLELRRAAALEARTGDPEAAKSLLARAIEHAPNPQAESEAARELAALHLKSDEVEKGIGLLKEVVRDPLALGRAHLLHLRDADRARAELAQVTDEKGRAEAEPLLMAMSELDADALEQFCLAAVAKSNGDLAAAVEHGGQVVELSPHSHTAKGLAADVAKMAPDVKERSIALEALDQVIRAYPDRVEGDQAKLSKARVLRASRSKGPPWRLLFWRTKSDEPPPPKRFADVKEIYDQLEFAQSRSPRVAQVLSDAAEFLAEDLRDYPGAADKLEKLIAFKAGSRDAAKEVSEEKVKEFSEQLLGYELRAIDLYLTKLNDVPKAMAVARRSPGFELKGDRVDVKGILEVIKRFDEARRHKEANALLAEAMKAASPDDWFGLTLEDLAYMAKFVKKDVLVRCRLGHLPGWLDSRIQIALASLTQQTQDAEVARFAMQVLGAWTGREIEKLLEKLPAEPVGASERAKDLKSLAYYVLGNYFQTKRDAKQALFYYRKLLELDGSADDLKIIAECESLVPRYSYVALRWLDAERAGGGPMWNGIVPILAEIAEPGKTSAKDIEREAVKAYEEFIQRYAKWTLVDDAHWRLSALAEGRTKTRYLLRLIEECPNSRYVPQALKQLADAYEADGNLWLGVQVLETLRQLDTQQGNAADIRAAASEMRGRLKVPDAWAMDARRAEEAFAASAWEEAAALLERLLARAPRYPWLRDTDARLALARCYASLSLWDEAELAYFKILTAHWDVSSIDPGSLLPEVLPRFSDRRILDLYRAQPKDILAALPKLNAEQKERVEKLLKQSRKGL